MKGLKKSLVRLVAPHPTRLATWTRSHRQRLCRGLENGIGAGAKQEGACFANARPSTRAGRSLSRHSIDSARLVRDSFGISHEADCGGRPRSPSDGCWTTAPSPPLLARFKPDLSIRATRSGIADHLLLLITSPQLSRSKSSSSDSSKNKNGPAPTPAPAAPAPQVTKANGSKPVPPLPSNGQPTPAVASLSNFGIGGNGGSQQQQGRNSSEAGPHGQGGPSTPDRKSAASHDKTSPAPPVVVVSTEMPQDPVAHGRALSPGVEHGSGATPPKAGPLGRLRGVKDTIPVTGKTPRKQRSSRFHVTEKHELEKLPQFHGVSSVCKCDAGTVAFAS